MRIRPAFEADAEAVRSLVQESYAPYLTRMPRPPAPMSADYADVLRTSRSWVAELVGRIAGVVVTRIRPDHVLIENVAVLPAAQGHGVGTLLLDVAERHAADCGVTEVRLYTNEVMSENLGFYPSRGYVETGRGSQDGFRRVFFTKLLAASAP